VLSLLISRRISQPIVAIKQVAERFAGGELDLRVPTPDSVELAALAGSLNKMATQLGERITTITEQRNELDAVLSSMVEGVFAVDTKGRIVSMNPAAAGLLGIDPVQAQTRQVEEIVRNVDLQEFVRQTLAGVQPDERDISLPISGGQSFSLHGACLTDARGRRSGAVIVLNDTTRIRRLEAVRRDFVANVSHELKTPVTSIQGFVEALADGSVQDPAQVERYLGIIARHAFRLNGIIDDLLTLSRLEEAGEQRALSFDVGLVKPVIEEAIHLSGVKADEKRMTIDLACDNGVEVRINPPLLEQAVINLIDNAVKYSPEGSHVRVQVRKDDTHVAIAVTDEGCGIPPEHLPRIFERFYVVDKSRSRKLGGTGLGLAIVKHIAQAHGGRVTVESTPGQGSTFTLHLPV
jgi:two-component system phosphate regulon sensor histidine kinase PhoR